MTIPYSKRAAAAFLEDRGWKSSSQWWLPPNELTRPPHRVKSKCFHRNEALVTELLIRGAPDSD